MSKQAIYIFEDGYKFFSNRKISKSILDTLEINHGMIIDTI